MADVVFNSFPITGKKPTDRPITNLQFDGDTFFVLQKQGDPKAISKVEAMKMFRSALSKGRFATIDDAQTAGVLDGEFWTMDNLNDPRHMALLEMII